MSVTLKDLEQALISADKAGDATSARLLAAEISKIQQSQQPQEGGVMAGAGKRISQVTEGIKGTGLRIGEAVGLVSPETLGRYQQQIQEERSVMSPTYRSLTPEGAKEIVGSTGVDVLGSLMGGLGLRAARAGFNPLLPTTVPEAAAGGSIYSLTTPSATSTEMLSKAGVSGVTGGITQFGLRQVGLAPQVPSALTEQQKEVARRALQQGFVLDPTQITGIGGELKEGMKRNLPIARRAFTRLEDANQEQTNNIAKTLINVPQSAKLTNETMQTAYNSALRNYKSLEQVPSIMGNQNYLNEINAQLARLNNIPAQQRKAIDKRAIRILNEYKDFATNPITGEQAFIRAKAIGDDLFEAQKSGSTISADAFKGLRRSFEDAIETHLASPANLMRTNGQGTLDQFRTGRKTLADWYLIKDAFNESTGNISAATLARKLSKKPTYGTTGEPIETAAMLSGAFPRAFPSSGTVEGQSFRTVADVTGLALSPLAYAATSQPVRNILGQRYFGAKPEGLIGRTYGGISAAGGYLPEPARTTFGRALTAAEQQMLNEQLQPTNFGLLGQ
jgi:hypothetical protein